MSSTHFSTLPSDCVQFIFDRIPTHHLLFHVRRVSRAWQGHQQLNCRARKTLIILQGDDAFCKIINKIYNKPFIKHSIDHTGNFRNHKSFHLHNKILISPENNMKINFLVETFPNLHTLIVSTDRTDSQSIQSFTKLIAYYSCRIVRLQLYFEDKLENDDPQEISLNMGSLLNQLNSLNSLQHLTVDFQDESFKFKINPQIEEPQFLTRIKEFYFDFYCLEEVMLDWVRKYDHAGRLGKLERFYLNTRSIVWNVGSIDKICCVPLANLYSFSRYAKYDNDEEDIKRIVSAFPSLITFKHTMSKRSINSLIKLTTNLSPLTKLVNLDLEIGNITSDELLNPYTTPQLTSLKALELSFEAHDLNLLPTFCQTQVPTIVNSFPNLQSIRITVEDAAVFDHVVDDEIDQSELDVCEFFEMLKQVYGRSLLRTEYYNLLADTSTDDDDE